MCIRDRFGGALNGTIKNCVSYATVYGDSNVGGIAGIRGQSTDIFSIENCAFHGIINATGNNIGGILGSGYYMYNAPNAFGAVIKNCTVDGNISGRNLSLIHIFKSGLCDTHSR